MCVAVDWLLSVGFSLVKGREFGNQPWLDCLPVGVQAKFIFHPSPLYVPESFLFFTQNAREIRGPSSFYGQTLLGLRFNPHCHHDLLIKIQALLASSVRMSLFSVLMPLMGQVHFSILHRRFVE